MKNFQKRPDGEIMNKKYAIFLSTCDNYEDCWEPFFKLFIKYWSDCDTTIYMVTDWKEYDHPYMDIKCIPASKLLHANKTENVSWGRRMRLAMNLVKEDLILFMQEDFFLKGNVKTRYIDYFSELMSMHSEIMCLHLTRPQIVDGPPSNYKYLNYIKRSQKYRVDCQPALWRKEEFLNVLQDEDSPWQFEIFGSKRSAKLNHTYLIVDSDWLAFNKFEIIPYVRTGISKGKWEIDVVNVFKDNDIIMDYEKRGFYNRGNFFLRVIRALEWRKELYIRELKQKLGFQNYTF